MVTVWQLSQTVPEKNHNWLIVNTVVGMTGELTSYHGISGTVWHSL